MDSSDVSKDKFARHAHNSRETLSQTFSSGKSLSLFLPPPSFLSLQMSNLELTTEYSQRALKTYKDEWKNGTAQPSSLHPEFDLDPETLAQLQREREDEEEGEETGIFAGLNKKGSQSQSQSNGKGKEKGKESAGGEDTFDQADLDDLFGDDDDALMASLEAEAMCRQGGGAAGASSSNAQKPQQISKPTANEDYDEVEEEQPPEEEDDEAMAAMREMEELLA